MALGEPPGEPDLRDDRPSGTSVDRAARICQALALVVPCALLTAFGGVAALVGTVAALVVASLSTRSRPRTLTAGEEAVAHVVVFGVVLGLFTVSTRALGQPATFGAHFTVGMLALAVPRAAYRPTRAARTFTLGFGLVALMGLARAVGRLTFGVATLAYLVLALLSTLQAEPGFGPVLRHRRGLLGPFAIGIAVAGGFMALLGWGLPAAEPVVSEYLEPYLGDGDTVGTGFSDTNIRLGEVREIQASDEVIARVSGTAAHHLRGQVYRFYRARTWIPVESEQVPRLAQPGGTLVLAEPSPGGPPPETAIIDIVGHLGRVVLLPEGTRGLGSLSIGVSADRVGRVLTTGAVLEASTYTADVQAGAPLVADPPGPQDTLIAPPALSRRLPQLSSELGLLAPGLDTAARLARLKQYLGTFQYTLVFDDEAVNAAEPVLDFLERSHTGHCELFATAFVLLARATGIPARLVTGFLVTEENLAGGYSVVRARDAHAWAEAWVEGTWRLYDPTPPAGLAELRGEGAGWVGQRLDLTARALGQLLTRLQNLTTAELLATLATIVALMVVFVVIRRRARNAQNAGTFGSTPPFEPLQALEAHLARRHAIERPVGRTLAAHAARLRALGLPRAAELLDVCADLRYGGRGDEVDVCARISAYLDTPEPVERPVTDSPA